MTQEELREKVQFYINENDVVAYGVVASDIIRLINKHVAEVIGEDEATQEAVPHKGYEKGWYWKSLGDRYIKNKLRAEQRKKAGLES